MRTILKRLISILLALSMFASIVSCMHNPPQERRENHDSPTILDNEFSHDSYEVFIYEEYIYEEIIHEQFLREEILYEEYFEEKVLLEEYLFERLLYEEIIEEVYLVETILIPEGHEFSNIDITLVNELFGHNVDLSSLLTRFSVGTGVVLTLTILSTVMHPGPVAVLVASAARGAQQGAGIGAVTGTISGAVMGAFDAIDETGRMSAVTALGLSIVGLIVSSLTFPAIATAAVPMLIFSGVSILATAFGVYAAVDNVIETFETTDSSDIDWKNIDWEAVGYTAAIHAIEGASYGVMVGAVVGAVYGAARSVYNVHGKTVIIDDSTFDPNLVVESDVDGVRIRETNVQRMERGAAPIGHDGRPVNIHHVDQTNAGAVMEIQATMHQQNHSRLHANTGQSPSQINRPDFDMWRADYWKWRASQFT